MLEVVRELGYVPNAAARTMVTKRTNIIGLMLPQVDIHWFGDDNLTFYPLIIQSISQAAANAKRPLLLSVLPAEDRLATSSLVLKGGHIDGVVLSVFAFDDPIMGLVLESRLPTVLIGRNPYFPEFHSVDVDNFASAVEATTYLITRGYQRVATLALNTQSTAGIQRVDGYRRALMSRGLPIRTEYITEPERYGDKGYQGMLRLLDLPEPPDAVFAASDGLALHAIRAIHDRGLRVPEDVAVIGFDDQDSSRRATPALTTVRQPIAEMGQRATDLLLRAIDGEFTTTQHIVLPTTLIIRASA